MYRIKEARQKMKSNQDVIREAQAENRDIEIFIKKTLVDENMTEFLKIDWAALDRLM